MMFAALHAPIETMGLLMLAALGCYVVATFTSIAASLHPNSKQLLTRSAWACLLVGGGCALASWCLHGIQSGTFAAGYAPLKNMYDVFALMAWCLVPLAIFFRRGLRLGGLWADGLMGIIIVFPTTFVFDPEKIFLMPALQTPLFIPHVVVYLLGYIIIMRAGIFAGQVLLFGAEPLTLSPLRTRQASMATLVRFGFPLMTLGMLLGARWVHEAFGDWWGWDPKEQWSLVTWLLLAAAIHVPARPWAKRFPRIGASIILLAVAAMMITLFWSQIAANLTQRGWLPEQTSYHMYSTK